MENISLNIDAVIQKMTILNYSRTYVCSKLGIPLITLRRWLNGQVRTVKFLNAKKLADCLGCEISEIINEHLPESGLSNIEQDSMISELEESGNFVHLCLSENIGSSSTVIKSMLRQGISQSNKVRIYYWIGFSGFLSGNFKRLEKFSQKCYENSKEDPNPILRSYGHFLKGTFNNTTITKKNTPNHFQLVVDLNPNDYLMRSMSIYFMSWQSFFRGDFEESIILSYKALAEIVTRRHFLYHLLCKRYSIKLLPRICSFWSWRLTPEAAMWA